MKFRDGMWLTAADKRIEYAEDIYTITPHSHERGLSLLCPTKHIRSRGDTLNLSTLHIDIEAAFDGVISVEVTHWKGARRLGPNFELYPDGRPDSSTSISKDEAKGTTLKSGGLSVTVGPNQHEFDIRFHATDGSRELTSLLNRSIGLAYSPCLTNPKQVEDMRDIKHYIFTQTELGVGESVHGLGERFGAFNKVGQNVQIWNEDGGTSSEQAYKNISFWMSNKGYGVFIDTPDMVDLEVGSERSCRVQTSVEGQRLKWYLIYGPTPKEILTKYSILTGKPQMVPAWSFGLWLSTSFTTDYDEKTVGYFLEEMKARSCPVEVFHYDCFWLRAFHWCDFVFDAKHFTDPSGQISRLRSSGLANKFCVWTNPYIGQASPVFAYAAEKGYLLKRTNGDVWQWDLWQTGMGIVDFTNPDACEWFRGCLEQLFDIGVDSIKTDFGERIPTKDVQWHDKSVDPGRMHNYYAFIYNKLVYEALEKRYGKNQAVLFARTACAGTQRFPLCWGGDCESTPAALAESLRGGISIGMSGYTFWSCDIGGFEGNPPPWIYKRWVAMGLLCSHSRLHGSNSYRVPWLVDHPSSAPKDAEKNRQSDLEDSQSSTSVLRKFLRLKRCLMPYLYAQAVIASKNGWPLSLRAMAIEFPDDPTAWFCDRQFMLGESILVAPVFTEHGDVEFYLPPGKWTSFWDGTVVEGPQWRKEKHAFRTLPLYVRQGSILLVGQEEGNGFGEDWVKAGGEVRVYHGEVGTQAVVVDTTGKEIGKLTYGSDKKVEGLDCLGDGWKVKEIGA